MGVVRTLEPENENASGRQSLELLLGRLYFVDTAVPVADLDRALDPLWQQANAILKRLFGDQTLQFHMFRQPSYLGAVSNAVTGLPGVDERDKYKHLIALFREDLDLALKRLDGPLPISQ